MEALFTWRLSWKHYLPEDVNPLKELLRELVSSISLSILFKSMSSRFKSARACPVSAIIVKLISITIRYTN